MADHEHDHEPNPNPEDILLDLARRVDEAIPPEIKIDGVEQKRANDVELLKESKGVTLSWFNFGDEIEVDTHMSEGDSEPKTIRFKLKPWKGQEVVDAGEIVRAVVTKSDIESVPTESEVQIIGASIHGTTLPPKHAGEIRVDCNLMLVPITFIDMHTTDYIDRSNKEIGQLIDKGIVEFNGGYYVVPKVDNPPIITPPVEAVYKITESNSGVEMRTRVPWSSPRALETDG